MEQSPLQDRAALRKSEAARERRFNWAMVGVMVGALLALFSWLLSTEAALPPLWGWFGGSAGALLLAVSLFVVWRAWPGADARALHEGLARREREQLQRRSAFFLLPVLLLSFLPRALGAVDKIVAGRPDGSDWWVVCVIALMAAAIPLAVAGFGYGSRPEVAKYLEDELSAHIRLRAFRLGYAVLLAGVLVLLPLGLYRPGWAVLGLAVVLALGAATPPLWFAWLDRRADRFDV